MSESGFSSQDRRPKTGDPRQRTRNGQALLFCVLLMVLAGILAPAAAGIWGNEMRLRSLEARGLIAFYLAQAGIEEAKIRAKNNLGDFASLWIDLGGGRYRYDVDDGPGETILNSTGQALDASGNVIAERRITARVDSGQVLWSWQEI